MTDDQDQIPVEQARQAVRDMARRVASLHMCYARVLVDELGERRGGELVKQAIWEYGTKVGERTRRRVKQFGLEPTLENMARGSDLSPLGFDYEDAVVDGEVRSRVSGCVLAEIWCEYGEEKLGVLYCQVDPAKMQAYHPGWTMVHTMQVPAGAGCCEIAVRPLARGA